jgi:Ni,Fe-hydrogenase III component G
MKLKDFDLELNELPGAMPVWRTRVDAREWRAACRQARDLGGRLIALWGADDRDRGEAFTVHAALSVQSGLVIIALPVGGGSFPDVSDIFPAAGRMQRAVRDLLGVEAQGAADRRKWLRHTAWGEHEFPLRKDFDPRPSSLVPHGDEVDGAASDATSRISSTSVSAAPRVAGGRIPEQTTFGAPASPLDAYPFVKVEGEGVHEIPVGPVHAGTIEPGHFRFSIVGEGVLKLEERLGYKHKGIEKRFETMTLAEGARLAGRVSGDSTVAYAWAYAMAVESAAGVMPPPRALWLRALLLERERIGQHLWDLGFLGNDAGLAFGLAQFSCLREDVLRSNALTFGHRYLMDTIVPGGIARDLPVEGIGRLRSELAVLEDVVTTLKYVYDEHAGLQDRFINCGRVTPQLADRLGLTGMAGRASGTDMRPARPASRSPVPGARRAHGDAPQRRRRGTRYRAVRGDIRVAADIAAHPRAAALRGDRHAGSTAGSGRLRGGLGGRLARRGLRRAGDGSRRHDTPLPSARSLVAELAAARARGAGEHRSGFPVDQQVVQSFVLGARSLIVPRSDSCPKEG